jgi:tetrahydromethanopterin:alpha-L-glutamate ligase
VVDLIPQIAIVTDDPGWHGNELVNALKNHGLGAHYVSLTECRFVFDHSGQLIRMPGFDNRLPLGVFVRGVPGGTLDQVIFRLDILHALVSMGITVYNDPRAIERTVDKAMTTFLLKMAGLPTPDTWVFESPEQAQQICAQQFAQGRTLVMKPLFGSQGIGVHRITPESGLIHDEKFAGLYYLQTFVERNSADWSDIRVFVINGKAIAAMRRSSEQWITNRAQGARCEHIPVDTGLASIAEAAANAVSIDYAGVDLIPDADGHLQVIEVNSIPAWFGLQSVTDFNIAGRLIDDFVRHIGEKHALTVLS